MVSADGEMFIADSDWQRQVCRIPACVRGRLSQRFGSDSEVENEVLSGLRVLRIENVIWISYSD